MIKEITLENGDRKEVLVNDMSQKADCRLSSTASISFGHVSVLLEVQVRAE